MSDAPRPRLIVADPDPETAGLLARQLQWAGYEVTTAGNGGDALELCKRLRPSALVTEVKMEGITGYELTRQLREDPRNRLMPVLMISARAGKLDRDFAFTVGADEYFRKPFLCSDVVAWLGLRVPVPGSPEVATEAKPIAQRRRPGAPLQAAPALAYR